MIIFQLIISYNPIIAKLEANIKTTLNQVNKIVIVDNGSDNIDELEEFVRFNQKLQLIKLNENKGIAAATNIGVKEAKKQDCDYLLLSDQDTCYKSDYVHQAVSIIGQSGDVIAVTPVIFDKTTNSQKPVYVKRHGFIRKVQLHGQKAVFQTIASGLFVKLELIDESLLQNEALFIDYVDFEWCWNAIYHGYKIIADENLVINHELGDKSDSLVGKKISVRNLLRYYYITRNTLYLSFNSPYINVFVRFQLLIKALQYCIGYTLISNGNKKKTFFILVKALRDGFFKRLGKKII